MQVRDGSASRTAESARAAQEARKVQYSEAVAADRDVCRCRYPRLPAYSTDRFEDGLAQNFTCQRCGGEFEL